VTGQDQAGFSIPADGKALSLLKSANGNLLLAASQNKGPLKLFKHNFPVKFLPTRPDDQVLMLHLTSGKQRRAELYFGQGFLSQSSRQFPLGPAVRQVEIINTQSAKRTVE
jgi:hypothetical protein